jgi:hypothetical protein
MRISQKRSAYLDSKIKRVENGNVVPFGKKLARRVVEDPYSGVLQTSVANVRADVLGLLLARDRIKHHHFKAGRDLEDAFERASVSGVKAMDFSREPVDGGTGFSDPYNDAKRCAGNFVAHAKRTLGESAFRLLEWLLRDRHGIEQVAGALGCDRRSVIARLKEALERLATATGNASVAQRAKRTPNDKHLKAARQVERGERVNVVKLAA